MHLMSTKIPIREDTKGQHHTQQQPQLLSLANMPTWQSSPFYDENCSIEIKKTTTKTDAFSAVILISEKSQIHTPAIFTRS